MTLPCEIIVRRVLPALRALIARELVEKHGLAQSKVASLLGVTQASVSHYLSAKRGKLVGLRIDVDELRAVAKEVADGVAGGTMGPEEVSKAMCQLCARMRRAVGGPSARMASRPTRQPS
ncbi:transcriptional regulator [Candidatus Bathyarchaeota archaeon]|nr:MAG: transcriptional regulator [Candidatus Bathyarchaeota archaeon]